MKQQNKTLKDSLNEVNNNCNRMNLDNKKYDQTCEKLKQELLTTQSITAKNV
jgi:hypothetical protein